jgi:ubiquinone/menaquinone biosynthesis C-methylase UbiE
MIIRKINNGLVAFFYYFAPAHVVWKHLSNDLKKDIKIINYQVNNFRPDYYDPLQYQNGNNILSVDDRLSTWKGKQILMYLHRNNPKRVLEIGPGSGYFTKLIVEHDSIEEYHATDINLSFLGHVEDNLSQYRIKTKFGDKLNDFKDNYYDSIILLSCLHHIPDRSDYINKLVQKLQEGGSLFFVEPTHYLPRWIHLLNKILNINGYCSNKYLSNFENLSTHHMLTLGEIKYFSKENGLNISEFHFNYGKLTGYLAKVLSSMKWLFSYEISVVLKRV